MNMDTEYFRELIRRCRAGDQEALGELVERHRPFLKLITLRQMGPQLGGRLDDSDLIQQTCLSIFGKLEGFAGEDPDAFAAWLRTIHERNVKNAIRDHVGTQKRSISREESLEAAGADGLASMIQSSPSQRVLKGEQAVQLAIAMQRLPDDQREAIRLRFLEGYSLSQMAEQFGRSKQAVAGLVKRGLNGLRNQMATDSDVGARRGSPM